MSSLEFPLPRGAVPGLKRGTLGVKAGVGRELNDPGLL